MIVAGFTFVHNAMSSGYPIFEAIEAVRPHVDVIYVVDMASTDGTYDRLMQCDINVMTGCWEPGQAGKCLAKNHELHKYCDADVIWHFEADEVYDKLLAYAISHAIRHDGETDLLVPRIQVEQNFQRVRWYPEYVHRVFSPGSVLKDGQTTDKHKQGFKPRQIDGFGYLWDVTNCYRDNVIPRAMKQAELWGHDSPIYRFASLHAFDPYVVYDKHNTREELDEYLAREHWTYEFTPLAVPGILQNHVGMTRYEHS